MKVIGTEEKGVKEVNVLWGTMSVQLDIGVDKLTRVMGCTS
jgi:hypothetical protein